MTSTHTEQYFYHSFAEGPLGLAILTSILQRGLLLTPELVHPNDPACVVMTKRICFTLLSPGELSQHESLYGPISLEWHPSTLRKMGALPVFYFPFSSGTPEGELAEALFKSLGHITTLLERLEGAFQAARSDPSDTPMALLLNEVASPTEFTAKGVAHLADILEHQSVPVSYQLNMLRCLSSLIQQTDDPLRENAFGNYRLREWRIVANLVRHDTPITEALTEGDVSTLLAINPSYLGRLERFRSGEHQIVRQCQLYRTFDDSPVHKTIRRIVAPSNMHGDIDVLLKSLGISIPVVSTAQA